MKLVALTLQNFRAYQTETRIEFDDLTTIIGRNDIGKSTILQALDIILNDGSIEPTDANVRSGTSDVHLTAEFSDLPNEITLDAGALTTLADEHLLNKNGNLVIRKTYDCAKAKPSCEVFIIANHPGAKDMANLLEFKEKELQAICKNLKLDVALKGNPGMRQAIWATCADLKLTQQALPVSKPKEDSKRIWEQIEGHLPIFALFQSDRDSKDSDGEIQNPMKAAVQTALSEAKEEIDAIQKKVKERAMELAVQTKKSLHEIDPSLASDLQPTFSPPSNSKWVGLFSLGMETDDNIPLNKRGSGVRRLILVSFFKAAAERQMATNNRANIIYAIEEPETSQHPSNQRILIEAFKALSTTKGCQVILTTHSPGLASDLPVESIRFVSSATFADTPTVRAGGDVFGEVAKVLGVTPDSRVKVILCVEGPTDVEALKYLSAALHAADPSLPNLALDERCAFVTLGGSTLKHWVEQHYLSNLARPEVHIYDGDVVKYGESVIKVNARTDGSWACQTSKHEMECYLHPDAIHEEFNVAVNVVDQPDGANPSVPKAFGIALSVLKGWDAPMGEDKSKSYLSRAFRRMTAARLSQRDTDGEVEGWLRRLAGMMA